jgi:hypothetical protein
MFFGGHPPSVQTSGLLGCALQSLVATSTLVLFVFVSPDATWSRSPGGFTHSRAGGSVRGTSSLNVREKSDFIPATVRLQQAKGKKFHFATLPGSEGNSEAIRKAVGCGRVQRRPTTKCRKLAGLRCTRPHPTAPTARFPTFRIASQSRSRTNDRGFSRRLHGHLGRRKPNYDSALRCRRRVFSGSWQYAARSEFNS